ncbi:MAG: carbohydrate-binding domain-containing protein [Acutalibacteraceae bacterium]
MKTKIFAAMLSLILAASFCGCKKSTTSSSSADSASEEVSSAVSEAAVSDADIGFSDFDLTDTFDESTAAKIVFSQSSVSISGDGASASGCTATVTEKGTYIVSGVCSDGQLRVEAKDEKVQLVFDNLTLSSKTNSPVYIIECDKTVITLKEGTESVLTDASEYTGLTDGKPNACVFGNDDITVNGAGSLTVNANYNNGIGTTDDLSIVGGNITVTAKNNGLKGNDSVQICGGTVSIKSEEDGIKSDTEDDVTKGFVSISGGSVRVISGNDGIQCFTNLLISGGVLDVTAGSGTAEKISSGDSSKKGLKCTGNIEISGGDITVVSDDDSVHSNSAVGLKGGNITVTSGDDGIHADSSLTVSDGIINVTKSYEGLEASSVYIEGGTVTVTSSDDGINAAGGADSSSVLGRPGQNSFSLNGDSGYEINICGGYVYVMSEGDGLDSNGTMTISGGTVIVDGPSGQDNTALDSDGGIFINGGIVMAYGSAGMLETPSSESAQNVLVVSLGSVASNTFIGVTDSKGSTVAAVKTSKACGALIVSAPDISTGSTYTVSTGGSAGSENNGYYDSYSGGSTAASITVSDTVTLYGTSGGMGAGGGGIGAKPKGGDKTVPENRNNF